MNQRSDKGHFSFSKDERITQKKVIEYLFNSAKKLRVYPFDIRFYKNKKDNINRVLISVPKGKIKNSVKRNLLKRRIREAYRLNKNILSDLGYSIAIIYSTKEILLFKKINDSLIKVLNKINLK